MKKSLMVVGLMVLACGFAAAGNWTFGFNSAYGGLYCNYEILDNNDVYGVAGLNGEIIEGTDNLINGCGYSYNAVVDGFLPFSLSKGVTFYGYKVTVSKGAVYGDNIYDASSLAYTGYQWSVASALACSTKASKKNKDWWIGVAGFSGFVFGDNAGPTSCTIPAKGNHNHLLTTGMAAK